MSPLASRRCRPSLASAFSQSLLSKAAINSRVSDDGVALAEGRQSRQTLPPPTSEKYL